MRSGLIGKKLGMTRVFSNDGRDIAVTVLQVEQHEVLSHKTIEKHGYEAVVVGTVETNEKRLTKPMQGYFKALAKHVRRKNSLNGTEMKGLAM